MLEISGSCISCHSKLCILDGVELACFDAHLSSTVGSAAPTKTLCQVLGLMDDFRSRWPKKGGKPSTERTLVP